MSFWLAKWPDDTVVVAFAESEEEFLEVSGIPAVTQRVSC